MIDVTKIDLTSLYDGAAELVQMYRQELQNQKVNASGDLSRSADFDFDFNEDNIVLYFIYNSYGYYVNEGRNATGGGGGQPWGREKSIQDISRWIENKISRGWFIPKQNKQIPRTDKEIKSVAYAIVRKIHRAGFYGRDHHGLHILEQVLNKAQANGLIDKMVQTVADGYDKEISLEIEKL